MNGAAYVLRPALDSWESYDYFICLSLHKMCFVGVRLYAFSVQNVSRLPTWSVRPVATICWCVIDDVSFAGGEMRRASSDRRSMGEIVEPLSRRSGNRLGTFSAWGCWLSDKSSRSGTGQSLLHRTVDFACLFR